MAFENLEDARHPLPGPVLPPAHAAERLAALAQFVCFVVAVERESDRAARAVLPLRRPQRPSGAHVIDDATPVFFRPLPRFEIVSGFVHGFFLLIQAVSRSPAALGR